MCEVRCRRGWSDTLPGAAVLPSWCVIDKRYQLTQEQFQARWCLNNVLAHIAMTSLLQVPWLQSQICVHVPGRPVMSVATCLDGALVLGWLDVP